MRVTASSLVIRGKVFDNKGTTAYVFQYVGLSALQYFFRNIDHHHGYPMKNQVGYDADADIPCAKNAYLVEFPSYEALRLFVLYRLC